MGRSADGGRVWTARRKAVASIAVHRGPHAGQWRYPFSAPEPRPREQESVMRSMLVPLGAVAAMVIGSPVMARASETPVCRSTAWRVVPADRRACSENSACPRMTGWFGSSAPISLPRPGSLSPDAPKCRIEWGVCFTRPKLPELKTCTARAQSRKSEACFKGQCFGHQTVLRLCSARTRGRST